MTEGALVTAEQTSALATVQATNEMYLTSPVLPPTRLRLQKEFASGQLQQSGIDGAVVHLVMKTAAPTSQPWQAAVLRHYRRRTTRLRHAALCVPTNPDGVLLLGGIMRARLEEGVNHQAITQFATRGLARSDGSASVALP